MSLAGELCYVCVRRLERSFAFLCADVRRCVADSRAALHFHLLWGGVQRPTHHVGQADVSHVGLWPQPEHCHRTIGVAACIVGVVCPVTDRRTDGRTDDRASFCNILNRLIVDSGLCPWCRILMNCSCLTVMVPPPGELLQNITFCLILAHCPPVWEHDVIEKTGSI